MRKVFVLIVAMLATSGVAVHTGRAAAKEGKKPNIMILATGGTIAGKGTATGHGYESGQFNVQDLITATPGIETVANLKGEQVANIGSQDMNDQVWLKLGKRVNQLLASNDVDGIVITHGTDTMEETAYFLNLVVKSDKPVVLVGSMRPATAISADGPGNLWDGVAVAADPQAKGRGVLVAMNDTVFNARDITKTHTTGLETMASAERGAAGKVVEGAKVTWFYPPDKKHTAQSEFSIANLTQLPKVDILYAYANMDPALITAAVNSGAKGLVIAGVGDGNMTKPALDALTQAAKSGVVVVRSSRVGSGAVLRNAEVKDDELGFVASGDLNPPKSRVLLQLALTEPRHSAQDVQRMFTQY
jgi:L-asparaginase